MACYAGITTDLQRRKEELQRNFPTMKNWTPQGPFENREKAQEWENKQYECGKHPGGNEPDNPNAKWHGYRFDY